VKEKLHVGQRPIGRGLEERHQRPGQIGGDALAEEVAPGKLDRDAIGTHAPMERPGLAAPERQRRHHVILQVLAHPPERSLDRDAVRSELLRVADAGQHEELRRIDDAAAEQYLALGARGLLVAVL
jgi:hypothetical protein